MRNLSAFLLVVAWMGVSSPVVAQEVRNPHGSFRDDCRICHTANSWSPMRVDATFDHDKTGFALRGAHAETPCLLCHDTLEFKTVEGSQCADCHQDVHLGELGVDCARCHSTKDFVDRSEALRQHRTSRFPLTGAHLSTDCAACHLPVQGSPMRFINTPMQCEGCHAETFRTTSNPDHVAAGFPMDCAQCHSTLTWGAGDFDHALTGFALTGAHQAAQCASCHTDLTFQNPLSPECSACHLEEAQAAVNPSHTDFPTTCSECHSTNAWQPAALDHDATAFPLTGAHVTVGCAACHVNGTYTGTPLDCFACHETTFNATTQPAHASSGISTDCVVCHTTSAWQPATVDHDATAFPLTGAHVTVSCGACHTSGTYSGTPLDCFACHETIYNATTAPAHASSGISTDCVSCHSTAAWQPATFNHDTTAFPLTGAHRSTSCVSCHTSGTYPGTPTDCFACHQATYNATTAPAHASSGISTDCVSCHSTAAWQPATFDHNTTAFPLTGAHRTASCVSCHTTGTYAGTPTDCFACHEAEYTATTRPVHTSAGFGTDCARCHDTTQWLGATFDHDTLFPIYSGRHTQAWNDCADCHVNASNYAQFECILCHEHSNEADLAGKHQGRQDYQYLSSACYSCHPDGRR